MKGQLVCLYLAIFLHVIIADSRQSADKALSRPEGFDFRALLRGLKSAGSLVKAITNILGLRETDFGTFINGLPFLDLPASHHALAHFDDLMKRDRNMTVIQKARVEKLMAKLQYSMEMKTELGTCDNGATASTLPMTSLMLPVIYAVVSI
ncbi:uncharacterized protein [Haliotis cracherodii]|uniref:uncharacterized protein n=1 Tax=Haliotis cracherodii TaxID=6455 RepID=UPI0039E99669